MTITWAQLTSPQDDRLEAAFALYEAAFPKELREARDVFYASMHYDTNARPNRYHLLTGWDEAGKCIAFASFHYMHAANVGFIVYIVTDTKVRSKGLGSATLREIERICQADAAETNQQLGAIVLESERKEDAHDAEEQYTCERREAFFRKNGYVPYRAFPYAQPALHPTTEPVPLHLYAKCFTAFEPTLPLAEIKDAIYSEKYARVN
ncbi:MAG: GNAT family N-acetyltransferase, partial [Bacilli bacterium]